MLTELRNNELLLVHGGDAAMIGIVLTSVGTMLSTLAALFHAAGDPDDPEGEKTHTIFTERTANIITFSLTAFAIVATGAGTILSAIGANSAAKKTN